MPADFSAFKVGTSELSDSAKYNNGVQAAQDALNNIGDLSRMGFATGAIFDPAKIMQSGATDGQVLAWSAAGGKWQPATGATAAQSGDSIGYGQVTASVGVTATTEAAATVIVTAGAVSLDGASAILVDFFAPQATVGFNSSTNVVFCLFDGSSSIGQIGSWIFSASGTPGHAIRCGRRLTPSAGSHTYSVRAFGNQGSGICGNVSAGPGGSGQYLPAYIRVNRD